MVPLVPCMASRELGVNRVTASVLIIDDSQMVRTQVANCLKAVGYAVLQARDGVEALDMLRTHPDTRLVVCDVNMPRMNGIEFLEGMKSNGVEVPVVMLTTEAQPEQIRKAKDLGAKGWLHKPFKPEHLVTAVKKWVPLGG
jgi:two-component system, chemotaxis family, chemotaxis protein CheY